MSAHADKSEAQAAAILAALREVIPGFALVERDVSLSGARPRKGAADLRADWVGTDRSGRTVLAAWKESGDDEAILWAVEACASRVTPDSGMRSFGAEPRVAGDGASPLLVLIVRTCSARLLAALSLLPAESFALLEVHGRGSAKVSLVRRELRAAGRTPRNTDNGIEAWPSDLRVLAESLADRVRRIDPAIERTDSRLGLQFFFRGEQAAGLALQGGRLVGAFGTGGEPASIGNDTDGEAWLEQALLRHAVLLRSATRPTRPADLLTRAGPLLSAEELAAFRDD